MPDLDEFIQRGSANPLGRGICAYELGILLLKLQQLLKEQVIFAV
jgi:hypothetical protein